MDNNYGLLAKILDGLALKYVPTVLWIIDLRKPTTDFLLRAYEEENVKRDMTAASNLFTGAPRYLTLS